MDESGREEERETTACASVRWCVGGGAAAGPFPPPTYQLGARQVHQGELAAAPAAGQPGGGGGGDVALGDGQEEDGVRAGGALVHARGGHGPVRGVLRMGG